MSRALNYVNAVPGSLGYMLYLPEGAKENLPLLVYLHGAGERGEDLTHLTRHGIPKMLSEGREFEAIVLCPQCPAPFVWNNVVREVKQLIDKVISEFEIKPDRILITGSSMGGYGTWEMGLTYPNFFAGIAPVCGGAMPWRAGNLRTTPVMTWHGDKDDTVASVNSELMVEAINRTGGKATLHVLKGFGHNDGIEEAYCRTELIAWLLCQRRIDFTPVPEAMSEYF